METFILIPGGIANNFKGKAKRDGIELPWKAIEPIPVKSPANKYILPSEVLQDPDIMSAFPPLKALPLINKTDIVFFEYDEDLNEI